MIELCPQRFQFVGQHQGTRQQIEHSVIGAGDGRIKLPSWKDGDAAGAHGLLDDFLVAGDALPGKTGMHRPQQFFADRSLGERKQQSFIRGIRRALGCRIKLSYGLDLVPEKLDAHRTLVFRRVHIENAAAQGVFSGHFDYIGGVVANRVEVGQQRVDVERFATAHGPRQIGVILGRTQAKGGSCNRRNHERRRARGNLPQRNRPLFLDLRVWRQILEGGRRGWEVKRRIRDRRLPSAHKKLAALEPGLQRRDYPEPRQSADAPPPSPSSLKAALLRWGSVQRHESAPCPPSDGRPHAKRRATFLRP